MIKQNVGGVKKQSVRSMSSENYCHHSSALWTMLQQRLSRCCFSDSGNSFSFKFLQLISNLRQPSYFYLFLGLTHSENDTWCRKIKIGRIKQGIESKGVGFHTNQDRDESWNDTAGAKKLQNG